MWPPRGGVPGPLWLTSATAATSAWAGSKLNAFMARLWTIVYSRVDSARVICVVSVHTFKTRREIPQGRVRALPPTFPPYRPVTVHLPIDTTEHVIFLARPRERWAFASKCDDAAASSCIASIAAGRWADLWRFVACKTQSSARNRE